MLQFLSDIYYHLLPVITQSMILLLTVLELVLVARLSVKIVITILKSCLFTEVLNRRELSVNP